MAFENERDHVNPLELENAGHGCNTVDNSL